MSPTIVSPHGSSHKQPISSQSATPRSVTPNILNTTTHQEYSNDTTTTNNNNNKINTKLQNTINEKPQINNSSFVIESLSPTAMMKQQSPKFARQLRGSSFCEGNERIHLKYPTIYNNVTKISPNHQNNVSDQKNINNQFK